MCSIRFSPAMCAVGSHPCGARRRSRRLHDAYGRAGGKSIYGLRRGDVIGILNEIADDRGPVMADRCLTYARKAFNWSATRNDAFDTPIGHGARQAEGARPTHTWTTRKSATYGRGTRRSVRVRPPAIRHSSRRCAGRPAAQRGCAHRWEEVEGDRSIIPAQRAKNGIENVVPLTARVWRCWAGPQGRLHLLQRRRQDGVLRLQQGQGGARRTHRSP